MYAGGPRGDSPENASEEVYDCWANGFDSGLLENMIAIGLVGVMKMEMMRIMMYGTLVANMEAISKKNATTLGIIQ